MPGKTLVLVFHPDLAQSRANAALAAAARTVPDTEVVDMQALYPDSVVDTEREVTRLLTARRVVLQFPVQWYSMPPVLRAWQDAVLTRMFYLGYETEGRRLEGMPLLVAATAGNVQNAYSAAGPNLFPLETLLSPLEAMAHRCKLAWTRPFLVYRANKLSDDERLDIGIAYKVRLIEWINTAMRAE